MISTLKNTRVISFGVSRFRTYYTKDMVDSSDKKHDLEIKKNEQGELKEKIDQYTIKLSLQTPDNSSISKDSRLDLEKKINGYIKEIDRCIALLGDQG